MVGQRNRVWIARLAIGVAVLALLIFGSLRVWHRLTRTPIDGGLPITAPKTTEPASENPTVNAKGDDSTEVHPLAAVLQLAKQALNQHREQHKCYTASLAKTERIGPKLMPQARMDLKLRYEPPEEGESIRNVSVYLKFNEPKGQAGREVIYSHGKNDNLLCAHETGFLGILPVNLAPNSRIAMIGNRYPITEIGIEKLLVRLIEKGERDILLGDCKVNRLTNQNVGGRSCELIEVIHPEKVVKVDGKTISHEFHIARIWFDDKILVPIKYASYSWPTEPNGEPVLEEEYEYNNLVLNSELTDKDFDTKNSEYNF